VTNLETKSVTTKDKENNGEVSAVEAEAEAIAGRRPKRLSPTQQLVLINNFYEKKGERDNKCAKGLNKSKMRAVRVEGLNRKRMEAEIEEKAELVAEADTNSKNSNRIGNLGLGDEKNSKMIILN